MNDRNWRDRAPAMLRDTFTGPRGEPCFTSTDRRWLWHLENYIAVGAPHGSDIAELGRDLRQYLHETCEHHWLHYEGDEVIDEHHQCVWCNDIQWTGGAA